MQIAETEFLTDDLPAQKEFYLNRLDLAVINENENSFTVYIGLSKLTFQKDINNIAPCYHFAINIPENHIEEAIEWLNSKNINLIEHDNSPLIDFKNWNAHSVYFYDSSCNIVELIARHNLPNRSIIPFSQSSFLCISEIGMPVENVKSFVELLEDKLGEKKWSGNFENFAAVGDEDGLFIVVTTQRNWFPTDKPCNQYPFLVKIYSPQLPSVEIEEQSYKIIVL